MERGILSLADVQTDPLTGRPCPAEQRLDEIASYAALADQLGLDVFALGEHHTFDFAVASPAGLIQSPVGRRADPFFPLGATPGVPGRSDHRIFTSYAGVPSRTRQGPAGGSSPAGPGAEQLGEAKPRGVQDHQGGNQGSGDDGHPRLRSSPSP